MGLIINKASTHSNTHSLRYFAKVKKRTESEVLNKKMNRFFLSKFSKLLGIQKERELEMDVEEG